MEFHRLIAFVLVAFWALGIASHVVHAARAADGPTPEQLEALRTAVRGYVERDEVVGAEVLVLHRDRPVLHEAFGFADRESKRALATDQVHCIRSMTKPLVGTAAQMLIDQGAIQLDDPVSKWLPELSDPIRSAITVRHLLEHTSGLPLSSLIGRDLASMASIDEVVALAARQELVSSPGAEFHYSDDGADLLAAIIGKASGGSAEAFIRTRVIEPLGMSSTTCGVPNERSRCVSAYAGAAHAWTRYWKADDRPIFGCFLGSQGAYSTAADFAKLLALWRDDGVVGGRRLLSHAAIERGLALAHATPFPTGLSGTRAGYGQFWSLWSDGAADSPKRFAFGHGGSDGTMAWCFPERELIVLYFSQSRGGLTPLAFEEELDRVLFGHERVHRDCADFEGWWHSESEDRPVLVLRRNGKPTMDIPGRFSLVLKPETTTDPWGFELDPSSSLTLTRSTKHLSPRRG